MKYSLLIAIPMLASSLVSCQTSGMDVDVALIERSSYCNAPESFMRIAKSADELQTLLIDNTQLPPAKTAAKFNLDRFVYVIVAAGTQPSLGYGYEITGDKARLKAGSLLLPLRFVEPAKQYGQAQVIMSPCVVLAANKKQIEKYTDAKMTFILHSDIE